MFTYKILRIGTNYQMIVLQIRIQLILMNSRNNLG